MVGMCVMLNHRKWLNFWGHLTLTFDLDSNFSILISKGWFSARPTSSQAGLAVQKYA